MRVFVQHNNGHIRRERNAFGGAKSWKQHDEGSSADFYLASRRSTLIEQIQDKLAAEQLRDVIKNGAIVRPEDFDSSRRDKRRGGRNRRSSRHEPRFEMQDYDYAYGQPAMVTMTSSPVVRTGAKPAFKVVISKSGKICAVPLDSTADDDCADICAAPQHSDDVYGERAYA